MTANMEIQSMNVVYIAFIKTMIIKWMFNKILAFHLFEYSRFNQMQNSSFHQQIGLDAYIWTFHQLLLAPLLLYTQIFNAANSYIISEKAFYPEIICKKDRLEPVRMQRGNVSCNNTFWSIPFWKQNLSESISLMSFANKWNKGAKHSFILFLK